jgi:hypothetical protein
MMPRDFEQELTALQGLTVAQLKGRYAEAFGEPTRSGHLPWLIKRLAWRLQALAEGDLSQGAQQRARELANEADLRVVPPRPGKATSAARPRVVQPSGPPAPVDERLPPPGTVLVRPYKGQDHEVTILAHGFAYQGQVFTSLSALAKHITGSHCSGFFFFRLGNYGAQP